MTPPYDVIIVGGGPAGASAAFTLTQGSRRVLVLEKETLPRYKTCGGAISARVLEQFPFSFEPVIEARMNGMSYALGNERVTIPVDDCSLCMVMRADFDAYFLRHSGAQVRTGTCITGLEEMSDRVRLTTSDGEQLEAATVIGADGVNSTVARLLGLRKKRHLAGAIEIEAAVPPEVLHRFEGAPVMIFGEVGLGYVWIFPKAAHLSVGVGAISPRPGALQAALERVMQRFGISIDGQPRHGYTLPFFRGGLKSESIGTHRVLLAGDAAGLVDPFTGEGIRFAIQSGRLAAEAILSGRTPSYSSIVEREIGFHHRLGAALTWPFYGMPRAAFELSMRNPAVSRALIRMIDGEIGYLRLVASIIASFPGFMLRRNA